VLIDRGSARQQHNLEFDGPIWWHPLQIIRKHLLLFMYHRYLIQTFRINNVNRCLETSKRWQLQRNISENRRIKMSQTSRDVQNSFVHLHLVHTKNNIDSLTFENHKTSRKHTPDKLEWDFMDHTMATTRPLGVVMVYGSFVAQRVS
jgi:hypothetical protein